MLRVIISICDIALVDIQLIFKHLQLTLIQFNFGHPLLADHPMHNIAIHQR